MSSHFLVDASLLGVILIIALGAIAPAFEHALGMRFPELRHHIGDIQEVILRAGAVLLAARVVSRHPAGQASYLRWLMTTPWHAGMILPLGSVTPSTAEITSLGVLAAAMQFLVGRSWILPLVVFAGAYTLLATIRLTSIGPRVAAVGLWIGLIGLLRALPRIDLIYGIVFAMYVPAQFAMIWSLRTLPWGRDIQKLPEPDRGLGHQRLSPRLAPPTISTATALAVTFILGWAAYCVTWCSLRFSDSNEPGLLAAIAGGMALISLLRLVIYTGAYQSPISLWGRLWTGRWILRGYDYVAVGPALAAIVSVGLAVGMRFAGISDAIAASVTVVAVFSILFFYPPTLNQWRFTGHHRIILPQPRTSVDRTGRRPQRTLTVEPQ